MAQPAFWQSEQSYTTYASAHPASPFPPASLDNDFANLKITLDQTLANLAVIQRDDTLLANESVHPDALSNATLNLIGDWTPRGFWATGVLYNVRDLVTVGVISYVCNTYHLSTSSFSVDLARGYWQQVNGGSSTALSVGDLVIDGTEGSVLFIGAGGVLAQDNANFFWDDTDFRLGLGTNAPTKTLHVVGDGLITGELVANPSYANIKVFGGDPTGAADTVAAFNAAIAAGYRAIYFPKGTYKFLSGVSVSGGNLTIMGDGSQVSNLVIAGAAGFDFLTYVGVQGTATTDQLVVKGVAIKTSCASAAAQGVAINAQHNAVSSTYKEPIPGVILRDVFIGNTADDCAWEKGIYFDSCPFSRIEDCYISGFMTGGSAARVGVCIDLVSRYTTNNNQPSTDINILGCTLYQGTIGVAVNNSTDAEFNSIEGVHIDNCTFLNPFVGVKIGDISHVSTVTVPPGFFIRGNHIATTDVGIDIQASIQWTVQQNLFYGLGGTDYSGVRFTTEAGYDSDSLIAQNVFFCFNGYSGNTYGVEIVGDGGGGPFLNSVSIDGNHFSNFDNAVLFGVNTTSGWVYPNNLIISGGTYLDLGANNFPAYGGGGGIAIGDAVGGGTNKSILYVDAGGLLAQDNAAFNWDDGAGTINAPSITVHSGGDSTLIRQNSNYLEGYVGASPLFTFTLNSGGGVADYRVFPSVSGYLGINGSAPANETAVYAANSSTTAASSASLFASHKSGSAGFAQLEVQRFDAGNNLVAGWTLSAQQADTDALLVSMFSAGPTTTNKFRFSRDGGLFLNNEAARPAVSGNFGYIWADTEGSPALSGPNGDVFRWFYTLENLFIGDNAGNAISGGTDNIALGKGAIGNGGALTGSGNFAAGKNVLGKATGANGNVGIGNGNTMAELTTGDDNVALGESCMTDAVTGFANFAAGYNCLPLLTSGSLNFAWGDSALSALISGSNNIALGETPLVTEETGSHNIAIGQEALNNQNGVSDNIGIGRTAFTAVTTGNHNTGVGAAVFPAVTTGTDNTGLGYTAGTTSGGTASQCTMIGSGTVGVANVNNQTAVGYGATTTGANQMVFGNTSVVDTFLRGKVNLNNKIYPGSDAAAAQTTAGIYAGSGVPNNANGNNGDFYFRGDTPGTATQRIYIKSGGSWVATAV